jgi:hypothetical protein
VLVKEKKGKLTTLGPSTRRSSNPPNLPSMSSSVSESSSNGKPNAGFATRCEKSTSENRKSIEFKDYESGKSENRSKNKNANVASVLGKNVSRSVSGVCTGMSRSSASENNALHASKNGWLVQLRQLQPHYRVYPRYSLTLRLSKPFPSPLSFRPTRENTIPSY